MGKIRALLAAVVTVCGLLLGGLTAAAADTGTMNIISEDTVVRKGQTVELEVSLSIPHGAEDGVNVLKGTLLYDREVFEDAQAGNFEGKNSWERLFYNQDNGQFVLIHRAGSGKEGDVFRLTLTAKQDITAGETWIKVTDAVVSDGKENVNPADSALSLSAVSDSSESADGSEGSGNSGSDGSGETVSAVRSGDSAAGALLICGAALLTVIAGGTVYVLKKKKSVSRKMKILAGVIICIGGFSMLAGGMRTYAFKGDINDDSVSDYSDVELLERHLIGLEEIPKEHISRADMDGDSELTVKDIAILIRRIEKNLKYEVELQSVTERFYYGKGEETELKFRAEVPYGAQIERVMIDGREYPAEKAADEPVYTVRPDSGTTSGVRAFHMTNVILDTGYDVTVDYTEKIDVLKEEPYVENFLSEELTDTAQMKVSFSLRDPDQALTSAFAEVIKNSDGTQIISEKLSAGENELALDLEENEAYTVHLNGNYNRDSDELDAEEDFSGSFSVVKEVELNLNYRFTFGGMKTAAADGNLSGRFGKNEPILLLFESGNNTGFVPERITVNGKSYPVNQTESGYSATLDGFDRTGETKIRAEQIVLTNGKAFELTQDNVILVHITKERPQVQDLFAKEDEKAGEFLVSFRLSDPDRALSAHRILIRNADGDIAAEQQFTAEAGGTDAFEETVPLSDTGITSAYTVQIAADCDLSEDGSEAETGKVLSEYSVQARPRVIVTDGWAEKTYVEKGEEIGVFYRIEHNTGSEPAAVVCGFQEEKISPEEDGSWQARVASPEEAGPYETALTQVLFADGTILDAAWKIRTEVLKDLPSAEGFSYEKTAGDELAVYFEIEDPDKALTGARVEIAEQNGDIILAENVSEGENKILTPLKTAENYTVTVTADCDRDSNTLDDQSNAVKGYTLLSENVSVSRDALEFKDVTGNTLYYAGNAGHEKVDMIDITGGVPGDVSDYYAVIEMENLPDFYAGIRQFRLDENAKKLYAVVDQADLIQYKENGDKAQEYIFPVAYRDSEGEHTPVKSAEELFRKMTEKPDGKFELTEDLDASGIAADKAASAGTFTGELDGNGYRIFNLPTSLFGTLSGAYVHDLVIEDAAVTAQRGGILADAVRNRTVIENVFIKDSSISNSVDGVGGFTGTLSNSTIRKSAAVDVKVRGLVAVGAVAGKTDSGALIEDCSVSGTVEGTYDHPSLGARAGGIAGWHGSGAIRRCIAAARIIGPSDKGNGGLIGGPDKGSPAIEYSISLSSGDGYRIAGFDVLKDVKEVYEFSGSDSLSNIHDGNKGGVKETDAVYETDFYEKTLGFDGEVWEFGLVPYGKLPLLKTAPYTENNHRIPGYEQVRNHSDYRVEREQAYANMAMLMPFMDTRMWVEYGNSLEKEDLLATGKMQYVLPLAEDGSLVNALTKEMPDKIKKVRVIFEDGKMQEYETVYEKLLGDVAGVYRLNGTDLKYQFRGYAADTDADRLAEALGLAEKYGYYTDIAAAAPENESRLYADYYEENVKTRAAGILADRFMVQEDYPLYSMHPAVRALADERIRDEEAIKRALYSYNYFDKWYHIEFNGVYLSDLLYFHGEQTAEGMTPDALETALLGVSGELRGTGRTVALYNRVLKNYTGRSLTEFIAEMSEKLGGYEDPNDWFADTFKGVFVEKPAMGDDGSIRYRAWDNLTGLEEERKNVILPILTAPQNDMYMISVPSQIIIGSMNRYPDYLNKDGQERERMLKTAEAYAEKMGIFYGVSSRWSDRIKTQLNTFVNLQYDTRLAFPESTAAAGGEQKKGETRDPVMKWVYEAVDMLNALNGSAAVANGSIVIWMWDPALTTSDYTFFTFSHETAHNQDGRYFYGGAGRRKGTGAEAHADGNIAQEMRDGCMVFNISKINDIGLEMPNNFSYERIDSAEKVHSYYREMFEAGYVLDYLAAQAFLELTPQQQAAVGVQANHTAGGSDSMSTVYKRLTAEEFADMGLKDMEDLWENRISVRNGNSYPETVGTATEGSYGFESFYTMNWYQSHNDSGSPDTHSFKRLGQEMLGVAGYEDGYMVYMSGLSENDLDALRKITGDSQITWKEYKLGRYRNVEQNLSRIPYFDPEAVKAQFKAAFEKDAADGNMSACIETKRMLYGMIKRVTADFAEGGIYTAPPVISVSTAEELAVEAARNPHGYYRLENDLDFSRAEANGSYIEGRFIGILDGNGYTLKGMQYPLFESIQHTQVKNLTIMEPSYAGDAQAMLAVNSKKTVIGDVKVENADMHLPLVKTKSEGYYEYGDMSVTVGRREITTPEELLAIGDSAAGLKKQYTLGADLDFSGTDLETYAVDGIFSGVFDGNGYTIRGLNAPLFEKIDGAEISSLTIEDSTLYGDSQKGTLAGEIRNAEIHDIRVIRPVINNQTNQVGGIAGVIQASTVSRVSVENASIRAGNTVGGIAGQFDGSRMEDCVVTGTLEGTARHQLGARIGGITGWLGGGTVKNCITKAEITAFDAVGNGGLIGGPNEGGVAIVNSVSLSTGVNSHRISGWNVLDTAGSAYELETSDSLTNIVEESADLSPVRTLTQAQAADETFYTDILGWSKEIWNFDALASGGVPALR